MKSNLTGFELTPGYVEEVRQGVFPKVLRNLWLLSLVQLTLMMLLVWAVVPYSDITAHPNNIISLLAEHAAGAKWLRYWLVTDAVLVLCASNPSAPAAPHPILHTFLTSRRIDRHDLLLWVHRTPFPRPRPSALLPPPHKIHQCTISLHPHLHPRRPTHLRRK